ncbi:DNA alkylation repair protein [Aeromicrobium ginsengisoli]|uniref:DNA alkylation repair protein n=1 Tax=Aeromicrobium ginsengisoli TaxID=363867 RepID=A0A5M4FJ56_9ACTN|nr:DNA alkylation repair protein [Aeromicrobium ginsengisoli]KAA1400091.1 DNA alkylation repair protein [Aeromicrobium ginsengisoli]
MSDASLVSAIRTALREAADAERAPHMQAYMKSAMPFLGVPMPAVRSITKAALRAHPPTLDELEAAVRTLWDEAEFREERYAASGLLAAKVATGRLELVPLYEHLATTGAWWDHVDDLAHRVAELHDAHAAEAAAVVRRWSTADDFWLRRLAIISQLGRRDRVDPALLTDVIEPNVEDTEFFVRKAIGWALREYARVEADWVRTFVADHPDLSGLSRREALKHL